MVDGRVVTWTVFNRARSGPVKSGAERVELPAEDVPDAVPGLLASLGRPGMETVLVLPPADVLLRVLRLPTVEPDEIRGMVDLQLDRVSPFPAEQVVSSYELLQQDGESVTVCLAIARKSVIEAKRRLLPGRDPVRVDASMPALLEGLRQQGALASAGYELLLAAGDAGVQVMVLHAGVPQLMVFINGPFSLGDTADRDEIAREAARLLWTVDIEEGADAGIVGTVWADPEFASALAGAVGRQCGCDCRVLDIAGLPSVDEGAVRRAARSGGLDLTPQSWRMDASAVRFRRQAFGGVAMLVVLWALLVGAGYGALLLQRQHVEDLRQLEQEWLVPANRVRNLRRRVAMIARYTDRADSALECLREIAVVQPQGIDLDSFTYRRGEAVDITGLADSAQLILTFNAALNRIVVFERVTSGPRVQTRTGRFRFSFELKLPGGRDDG